jgi:quercetin dioxygenase-like cupin family protein
MSSLNRELSGEAILLHLGDEAHATTASPLLERNGRNARTLIKSDAMRVTLIALAGGGTIAEHHADGPITVQVLSGGMTFTVAGTAYSLVEGDLLSVGAAVRHDVASKDGVTFLLTIAGTYSTARLD